MLTSGNSGIQVKFLSYCFVFSSFKTILTVFLSFFWRVSSSAGFFSLDFACFSLLDFAGFSLLDFADFLRWFGILLGFLGSSSLVRKFFLDSWVLLHWFVGSSWILF